MSYRHLKKMVIIYIYFVKKATRMYMVYTNVFLTIHLTELLVSLSFNRDDLLIKLL